MWSKKAEKKGRNLKRPKYKNPENPGIKEYLTKHWRLQFEGFLQILTWENKKLNRVGTFNLTITGGPPLFYEV